MDGVLDTTATLKLLERLRYLAWRWYRIQAQEVEDIAQAAFVTFLEVRDRYPHPEEHTRIFVGIFRNKCREHIEQIVRADRQLQALERGIAAGAVRLRGALEGGANGTNGAGLIDELESREDYHLILQALAELREPAREMFWLILEQGMDRQALLRYYGLNKNTLDSRLHTYRHELQRALSRHGVRI